MQHFPSVFQTLAKKMRLLPESWTLTSMYNDFLTRPGQQFNDRFHDFEEMEPCVMFTSNPFMEIYIGDISEQISVLYDLDCVPFLKWRLLSAFKMTFSLKSRQSATNFLSLMDTEKIQLHPQSINESGFPIWLDLPLRICLFLI